MGKCGDTEVRTSATHPLQVDWLPDDVVAGVGLTFAPGKRGLSRYGFRWERDLAADLDVLVREHRAAALVTLMEAHELATVGILDLFDAVRTARLASIHFPIVDVDAPARPADLDPLLDELEARLARGERLVIHCWGGIGRTGTVATCLLVRRGIPLERAMQIVQRTRCREFPESQEQQRFVERYAEHVARRQPPASTTPTPLPLPWSALGRAHEPADRGPSTRRHDKDAVRALLAAVEREVAAAPAACFTTDADGAVTLTANGQRYHAGRFETPTLGELEARLQARPRVAAPGTLRLSILRGDHPLTDIGSLQATAPAGTLFQVASQFNCLEAPGPRVVPVRDYPSDPTQGPRASVSAFAGTLLRHYFAPAADGSRFVQTDARGIELLADAIDPAVARVRSGYLSADHIRDADALAASLTERFDRIRVGLHADVEVVLGGDWGGPVPAGGAQRIAQVFTSTIALGMYSHDASAPALATVQQQLLRAAYLGTVLGALALGQRAIVLTLIGGGVFGNSHRAIWDAIHWALDRARGYAEGEVDVLVNARTDRVAPEDLARVRGSGGACIEIGDDGGLVSR